ncbi:MAG: prohibitin family protein [Chitinophagia bacterium]|jgi:regulator of protease activity HflC (stomatin/prohibitin superfamily)|nr:prohibitin family protein [Chitinophagia bacterium]
MFLIILGIIVFFAAGSVKNLNLPISQHVGSIRSVGLVVIALGILSSCIKQIDAGQIGVKSLFGKVQDDILYSGLNFVNPLVSINTIDIRTQNYTMSGVHNEGDQAGDDAIRVLTADGLEVVIDLTVLYRVQSGEAPNIIRQIGYDFKNVIVRPITRTKIRDNAVYYTAVDLYSVKRDEFQARIFKTIEANLKQRGFVLEQLLVRNITLPATVKASIEDKIKAEQDAQKMQFVLQKEKQEAERKRVEAQGIADYQRIISSGLGDKQLQYEQIQAMKGLMTSPNSKVIIMGGGKTPIILDSKGGN